MYEGGLLTITDTDNDIHLALYRSDELKPVSLAFGTSGDEYSAWKTHLDSLGIPFKESDHGLSLSIYFGTPFGN